MTSVTVLIQRLPSLLLFCHFRHGCYSATPITVVIQQLQSRILFSGSRHGCDSATPVMSGVIGGVIGWRRHDDCHSETPGTESHGCHSVTPVLGVLQRLISRRSHPCHSAPVDIYILPLRLSFSDSRHGCHSVTPDVSSHSGSCHSVTPFTVVIQRLPTLLSFCDS